MAEKKINTVLYDIDQRSDTTDEQKATARANIGAQAELTHDQTLVGDGTSSNPLGVDEVKVGPQWNGTSWSSRYSMGKVELNSRDVQTGKILIPLDRIEWPFTKNDGNFSFVLVNVCGIRLKKMSGRTITPGETWKVKFSMATAEEENRIYYNQDTVTDFDLVWVDGSFTDYKGGWSTIWLYDRSKVSPISLCLNFDFRDYKSSLDVGDLLYIHIEILPLSLRALNFG